MNSLLPDAAKSSDSSRLIVLLIACLLTMPERRVLCILEFDPELLLIPMQCAQPRMIR